MMRNRVIDNFGFFHLIPHSNCKKQIYQVLNHITKDQIQAIGELFVNILYGVLPIKESVKQKLMRYRKLFEYLANKNNPIKKRKKVLLQKKKAVISILKHIYPVIKVLVFDGKRKKS